MNTINKKEYATGIDFKLLYRIAQCYIERQGKSCTVQDIDTIEELYMQEAGATSPPRGGIWERAVSWLIKKDIIQLDLDNRRIIYKMKEFIQKKALELYAEILKYNNPKMKEFKVGGTYHSPLRIDKNASFSVFKGKTGEIVWYDFSTKESGNILDLFGRLLNAGLFKSIQWLSQMSSKDITGSIKDYFVNKPKRMRKLRFIQTRPKQIDSVKGMGYTN